MKDLLEKFRVLSNQLQNASDKPMKYMEIAEMLAKVVQADVCIAGKSGSILGYGFLDGYPCSSFLEESQGNTVLPEQYNTSLLQIQQTELGVWTDRDDCPFYSIDNPCLKEDIRNAVVPIVAGGQRQGSLVMVKCKGYEFRDEDSLLAEYGAMVLGMELLREQSGRIEEENRQKTAAQVAMSTLSYSEQEAIEHIFDEIGGKEALLVASKIADRVGITRSVIVNALRKLESAGLIETKSLGMKGTFIRVLNDSMAQELERKKALR